MNNIYAVICGNLRDMLSFRCTLARVVDLRKQGIISGIVLSTWVGEVSAEMRKKLEMLGVILVESNVSGYDETAIWKLYNFTMFRQHEQLRNGIQRVPNNAYVLKLRTDAAISDLNTLIRQMRTLDERCSLFGQFPLVFKSKVSAFFHRYNCAMWFADFVFLGQKCDIQRLCQTQLHNRDSNSIIVGDSQFFLPAFALHYPLFIDYLQVIRPDNVKDLLIKYATRVSDSEFYLPKFLNRYFALSFLIDYTQFNILPNNTDESAFPQLSFRTAFGNGDKKLFNGMTLLSSKGAEYLVKEKMSPSKGYSLFMSEVYDVSNGAYNDGINASEYEELEKWGSDILGVSPKEWLVRPQIAKLKSPDAVTMDSIALFSNAKEAAVFKNIYEDGDFLENLKLHFLKIKEIGEAEYYSALVTAAGTGGTSPTRAEMAKALYNGALPQNLIARAEGILDRFGRSHCPNYMANQYTLAIFWFQLGYWPGRQHLLSRY